MSYVRQVVYGEMTDKDYDIRTAMEEASRCLLCEDAPCSKGCPAGTDPGKFIRSIRFKNIKGAAETIRENNALGGCCALVCPYGNLCEKECSRTGIDKPIHIGKLQRFAVEYARKEGIPFFQDKVAPAGKRVACLGAGPSSLSCAARLLQAGVEVTLIDQNDRPGGMLTYGINPSRLPQAVVDYDIEQIQKQGARFQMNTCVDGVAGLEGLRQAYDALFVGAGLWKSTMPSIEGTASEGVYEALAFLKSARENKSFVAMGDDVLVIGGGDVAMDCAATAKQLGAKNVAIVYRRTIEEAPAYYEELHYVQSLGIPVITRFAPEHIVAGDQGRAEKMEFKSWDGVSTLSMKADTIIFATGQKVEDAYQEIPPMDGVFTGGDMVSGGATVVQAVGDGKKAAADILAYLGIKEEA